MSRIFSSTGLAILMASIASAQPGPSGDRGERVRTGPSQSGAPTARDTLTTGPAAAERKPAGAASSRGRRGWGWQGQSQANNGCPHCRGCCCGRGDGRNECFGSKPATQPAGKIEQEANRRAELDNHDSRHLQAGPGQRGMTPTEHEPIGELLRHHATIKRSVQEVPEGVTTTTTTSRPELVGILRTHVRQMAQRIEGGWPIRMWDPVFRCVFEHAHEIKMDIKDVEGGVAVTETSTNPDVVPLIRAHARKVAQFAEQGFAVARPPWAGPH